ncbi:hypothetical protein G6O67_003060 [Ophiocordyceps sinensis]|uniref:Uncharacterized protein n=2 Tax=Ophiocordyceps sinensis TaxID=72228 RepID=A0A8H4PVX5_9HYPO|nr:hypothetical protein OCS_01662 [Ophiocordyceps sinensis CO18]KAF4511243.1 hypothetical protein G6O67_003060 [Ophiocordyceps sinensis]
MKKFVRVTTEYALQNNTWQKFANPVVKQGKTVFPLDGAEQERLGVRWDYAGEVTSEEDQQVYHKFQLQANAGKVPAQVKNWRQANGGAHAVMATVFVKKDGTKEDVEERPRFD